MQSSADLQQQSAKGQRQEALLAGLLFALHPVHTEAVAGIVGQAELLCAALVILALLAYMGAVDGRSVSSHMPQTAPGMDLGETLLRPAAPPAAHPRAGL